jgi:phytoene dehydrogenase-like protein
MADKHSIVIGAGPIGLTNAMILAKRGCKVTVFEKRPDVGGTHPGSRLPTIYESGRIVANMLAK